jgi:hypothetical protein
MPAARGRDILAVTALVEQGVAAENKLLTA